MYIHITYYKKNIIWNNMHVGLNVMFLYTWLQVKILIYITV